MRAIVAGQSADLVTFAIAIGLVRIDAAGELNPTMLAAYVAGGLAAVAAWKLLLTGTLVLLAKRVRTRSRRPAILLGYALGLAGAASNLVAILTVAR